MRYCYHRNQSHTTTLCGLRSPPLPHTSFTQDCQSASLYKWARNCDYLGSFLLDPEDIRSLGLGTIWPFIKWAGLPMTWTSLGHRGPVKGQHVSGLKRLESIMYLSTCLFMWVYYHYRVFFSVFSLFFLNKKSNFLLGTIQLLVFQQIYCKEGL